MPLGPELALVRDVTDRGISGCSALLERHVNSCAVLIAVPRESADA